MYTIPLARHLAPGGIWHGRLIVLADGHCCVFSDSGGFCGHDAVVILALPSHDSHRHAGRIGGFGCARAFVPLDRCRHSGFGSHRTGGLSLSPNGDSAVPARLGTRHLPMQKLLKISPSKSSLVNSPVISPSASCARRKSSANSSKARVVRKVSAACTTQDCARRSASR
jgi:hypothetical protein